MCGGFGAGRAVGCGSCARRADEAAEVRRAVELPARTCRAAGGAGADRRARGRGGGRAGWLPLALDGPAGAVGARGTDVALDVYRESGGVHGAVARWPRDLRPDPGGGAAVVRAMMFRLVGEGEGDAAVRRRRAARRARPRTERGGRGVLGRSPTSGWSPSATAPWKSRTRRCSGSGRDCASGSTRTPTGRRLRRHLTGGGARLGRGRTGRGRALPRRPPRCRARLERRARTGLDELERAFVIESRARRSGSRARAADEPTAAGLLAGVAILLVAAVVGRGAGAAQRGEARDAETAQLAQRLGAQALVEEDLDRSLLLARQAVAIDDSPQTRSSLLAALLRAPTPSGSCTAPTTLCSGRVALSPDGGRSRSPTSTAGSSSSTPGPTSRSASRCTSGRVESVAYSPDGTTLALGGGGWVRSSTRAPASDLAGRRPGRAARIALHERRLEARRRSSETARSTSATRHAEAGSGRRSSWRASGRPTSSRTLARALRADARRSLARHRVRRRASSPGGTCGAGARRGARDRDRATTRSRSARTVAPSAVGIDGGLQLVDVRTGRSERRAPVSTGARTRCSSARTARRSCRRTRTGR